jgi:hypothetical protein
VNHKKNKESHWERERESFRDVYTTNKTNAQDSVGGDKVYKKRRGFLHVAGNVRIDWEWCSRAFVVV